MKERLNSIHKMQDVMTIFSIDVIYMFLNICTLYTTMDACFLSSMRNAIVIISTCTSLSDQKSNLQEHTDVISEKSLAFEIRS